MIGRQLGLERESVRDSGRGWTRDDVGTASGSSILTDKKVSKHPLYRLVARAVRYQYHFATLEDFERDLVTRLEVVQREHIPGVEDTETEGCVLVLRKLVASPAHVMDWVTALPSIFPLPDIKRPDIMVQAGGWLLEIVASAFVLRDPFPWAQHIHSFVLAVQQAISVVSRELPHSNVLNDRVGTLINKALRAFWTCIVSEMSVERLLTVPGVRDATGFSSERVNELLGKDIRGLVARASPLSGAARSGKLPSRLTNRWSCISQGTAVAGVRQPVFPASGGGKALKCYRYSLDPRLCLGCTLVHEPISDAEWQQQGFGEAVVAQLRARAAEIVADPGAIKIGWNLEGKEGSGKGGGSGGKGSSSAARRSQE